MSTRPMHRLAAAAVILSWSGSIVAADDDLACGKGFTKTSETSQRITCLRSATVRSENAADKVMRRWADKVLCSGEVVEPKSSMGQTSEGVWQVTIRYICSGGG